jgi:NAD(P)-dependent dehydrogenase (short-subunit alcohol dehydrogenase family)
MPRRGTLLDRKCFITGAASGIGRAVARRAAADGARLVLTDIDADGLDALVGELRANGTRVLAARAFDIADYDAVSAFADEVHAAHGPLDVVMNVAGISVWGTVERLEHRHWKRAIDVNLMGPIHVIECFIPPMVRAGRGGHLVNVSSAAGLFGLPWHAAYSASKFGLRGVSEVLRYDLRRHGIGVSLVCPGAVDTALVDGVEVLGVDAAHPAWQKLKERFRKRAVTPEKVADDIVGAIAARRYLVFTSLDVRIGHWFQRKFALPYELAMQRLNDRLQALPPKAGA